MLDGSFFGGECIGSEFVVRMIRSINMQNLNHGFNLLLNTNMKCKTKQKENRLIMQNKYIGNINNFLHSFPKETQCRYSG